MAAVNTNRGVLATDLDGTFLPLDSVPQNRTDLQTLTDALTNQQVMLVFVTGRHLASVEQAIKEFEIACPDWVICDVGSTICRNNGAGTLESVADYQTHQAELVAQFPLAKLVELLSPIDGLTRQEEFKQGPYKLSYYAPAERLDTIAAVIEAELQRLQAPWRLIHSVDPFNGDGLVDLLAAGVSKAYALDWWSRMQNITHEAIVFAGDSGNDYAAFVAGYRTIVVGNADREIARKVEQEHARLNYSERLYLAQQPATSGVLEGCQAYGLVPGTGG